MRDDKYYEWKNEAEKRGMTFSAFVAFCIEEVLHPLRVQQGQSIDAVIRELEVMKEELQRQLGQLVMERERIMLGSAGGEQFLNNIMQILRDNGPLNEWMILSQLRKTYPEIEMQDIVSALGTLLKRKVIEQNEDLTWGISGKYSTE